ncbi:MAG: hypothetical protein ABID54_00125 [Pseudomonadota bacterium]
MGAAFGVTPTWVYPREPVYPVIITASENFKKDYQLLDDNSQDIYDLHFDGISDAVRNTIAAHRAGVSGGYDNFVWTSVPSYLNAGTTMTVRYVRGSYNEEPRARSWEINFAFEKDV